MYVRLPERKPPPGLARLARGQKAHLFDTSEGRPNAGHPPGPQTPHRQRPRSRRSPPARQTLTHLSTQYEIRIRLQAVPPPPAPRLLPQPVLREQRPRRGSASASNPARPAYASLAKGAGRARAEGAGGGYAGTGGGRRGGGRRGVAGRGGGWGSRQASGRGAVARTSRGLHSAAAGTGF